MAIHTEVVARVKADLEARGVSLLAQCGAFQITKRVAWALRAEGAGLLRKPAGNNCDGFAVDIICYKDGFHYDILINSETENIPSWNLVKVAGTEEPLLIDPVRWAPPFDADVNLQPTQPPPAGGGTPAAQPSMQDVQAAILAQLALDKKEILEAIRQAQQETGKAIAPYLPALAKLADTKP